MERRDRAFASPLPPRATAGSGLVVGPRPVAPPGLTALVGLASLETRAGRPPAWGLEVVVGPFGRVQTGRSPAGRLGPEGKVVPERRPAPPPRPSPAAGPGVPTPHTRDGTRGPLVHGGPLAVGRPGGERGPEASVVAGPAVGVALGPGALPVRPPPRFRGP